MAKRRRSKSKLKSRASGGSVRVKGHSRGPRGPDRGKPRPHVRSYRRRPPSK